MAQSPALSSPATSSFGSLEQSPHFLAQTAPGFLWSWAVLDPSPAQAAPLTAGAPAWGFLLSECPGGALSISLNHWELKVLHPPAQRGLNQIFGDPAGDVGSVELLALPSQAAAAAKGGPQGFPCFRAGGALRREGQAGSCLPEHGAPLDAVLPCSPRACLSMSPAADHFSLQLLTSSLIIGLLICWTKLFPLNFFLLCLTH